MGNTLASFGRVSSGMTAIIATFISVIFLGVGVWLIFKKNEYTSKTSGVVQKSSCTPSKSGYDCNVTVIYSVDGKKYTRDIMTSDRKQSLKKGDTIDVDYNPKNPDQVEAEQSISPRTFGFILSFVGFAILIISWLSFYFTGKSKAYAQLEGVNALMNLF